MAKRPVKNKANSPSITPKTDAKTKPVPKNKVSMSAQTLFSYKIIRYLVAAVVIALLGLWVLLWQGLWRDIPMQGASQMLNIRQGQTYSGLIADLNKKGQIRLPVMAKIYQRVFIHDSLKAGVYEIEKGTSVQQLLQMLSDGKLAQMNRILVIEGTTFSQLRKRLDSDPYVEHQLKNLDNQQLLKALNIQQPHPEGWFAPDTYYFAKGESDTAILKHLYRTQKKIVDSAWQQRAANLPYKNAYEALIMASIVEKETGITSERADVAGVFVRRLKIGMRLQTDPTVIYGMGTSYAGNIRRQDLITPTPYNTYTISGLPPTPIALPSKAAIEATLHPASGSSLYFVATGTGGHTFSSTLEQHNQAVANYLTVMRQKRAAGATR